MTRQSTVNWKNAARETPVLGIYSDDGSSAGLACHRPGVPFTIESDLKSGLVELSQNQDTTLLTTLLAVFKMMLHRYNVETVVSVQPITDENKHRRTDYGSLMIIRSEVDGEGSFIRLLKQLKTEMLVMDGALNRNSCVHNNHTELTGDKPKQGFVFSCQSKFDSEKSGRDIAGHITAGLVFTFTDIEDKLHGNAEYSADLYEQNEILAMTAHYVQLIRSAVKAPRKKVGRHQMLTPEERHALLYEFNDTVTTYSSNKTLSGLFEEQVLKAPGDTALIQDGLTMSYFELNAAANRLANYLIAQGVKTGDSVGLIVNRGFNMITGMYAIMKTGAAYVPIDPEYPLERQEYMLHQSGVELILTDSEYLLSKKSANFHTVNFTQIDLASYDCGNPGIKTDKGQLAYTIYTSGSTGLPKGVMIEHHSAVNLIQWVNREFNVNANDRLLFITSMCFDLSVYDIFGILSAGGSIVIARQHEVIDVVELRDLLQRHKITFWDSVPTTMNYLIKELATANISYVQKDLRLVFMSGDWIPVQLPKQIAEFFPNAKVISLGGATEATVWSNYFPVTDVETKGASIPYGKPISNNFFYVLNEQLQPVPRGVTGELYIGGVGVARGYANDKDKTDRSFIKDPYNKKSGGRMYRTGDLGRMLPDGNLEFQGRKDTQIKIRGFRVELGEIESLLNQFELINQAVVIVKNDQNGNKSLVAFIVPKKQFDKKAIAAYLKRKLPDYMIPGVFVELQKFPLTANGKIDKKCLTELEVPKKESTDYQQPKTQNQKKLAAIWQEVLGIEEVGIYDNFFELGGHSLIAVKMISKLEKEMDIKLPLAILFKHPTISSLLSFIEQEYAVSDINSTWKSLVPIKASGSKMPIYIIHGSGLNVLGFNDVAMHVDEDQPVFGLQAQGLNDVEQAPDDMVEIARSYISEILEHNPTGPYAIAGYSFGGYVAVEMRRQLELMDKHVKMLAIFDTNAIGPDHHKLVTRIKRQFPKLGWLLKSLIKRPVATFSYQHFIIRKRIKSLASRIFVAPKADANDFYTRLDEINQKHWYAFRRYELTPFNDVIHLFRASERIYFVDDFKYLGWNRYAKKGVRVYKVSGDHRTMLLPPHAKGFARTLQQALDNC